MNRSERRKQQKSMRIAERERQSKGLPPKVQATREQISESLVRLVRTAHRDIQRELNLTLSEKCPPMKEMIMLVMDGESPLAVVAPPQLRQHGARGYAARLVPRSSLATLVTSAYPMLAQALSQPGECGNEDHLEYIVSTGLGGVLKCVQCDLQLSPQKPS